VTRFRTYPVVVVTRLSWLINVVWLAGFALQILLLLTVFAKRVWKRFPFFAAYVILTFVENAAAYALSARPNAYFLLYVVGETLSILVGISVVYEVFRHLFSSHRALSRLAANVFGVLTALFLIVGVAVVYFHGPIGKSGMISAVMVLEEAARIVQVGLIMGLFVCSSAFGLHWRQQVFGVGLGLGTLLTVKLITVTMQPLMPAAGGLLNLVWLISFDLCFLVWIGYLLVPERVASAAELPQRSQLEQWNQAVMELIRQ
jgi:hypothetical protein